MTIKIERDSPLRVIDTSSSLRQGSSGTTFESSITSVEDDFVVVDFQPLCSSLAVGKLRSSTIDDDTASTGSLSSDSYDSSDQRRVSFADDLVTQVWTRPFTPRSEVSNLFYSTEETTRYVSPVEFYVRSGIPRIDSWLARRIRLIPKQFFSLCFFRFN